MIADTTFYPWIIKNELTFFVPSMPLLDQLVKFYQSGKTHRGPSNLIQTPRPRLRLGNVLCSVAPITLQKSCMEHAHQTTKPKWLMNQHGYSNFSVLRLCLLFGSLLMVPQTTSNTMTYWNPLL